MCVIINKLMNVGLYMYLNCHIYHNTTMFLSNAVAVYRPDHKHTYTFTLGFFLSLYLPDSDYLFLLPQHCTTDSHIGDAPGFFFFAFSANYS